MKPSAVSPSADERAKGTKYVYRVLVLTGKCAVSSQEEHHSVVDNTDNPNTYTVFSGDQAYPEYLIMFQ